MRANWLVALGIGVGGIAVITVVFATIGSDLPTTIPALLLLVPVTAASVLSNRFVALVVAVLAACTYALAFIPPIGAIQIGLTEDVFVLLTFVLVALLVGVLKLRDRSAGAALLDDRRAILLRGVSHDLRTPLTTIHAISTDLREGAARYDEGTRHELLTRVVHESERLDRIVGNLLSVSRVNAGVLAPAVEPESVAILVSSSVERLQPAGGPVIVIDIDPHLPDVRADAVQIDQVLSNLLDNALTHGSDQEPVTVSARRVGDGVEVIVSDHGPGFSGEALANVFQPLRRTTGRSTGLGLTVCKAIVEAHGGTISVGDSPDGGARVRFTLPVDDADDHGGRG